MTHDQFLDVLREAHEKGWVSDIVCSTHEGVPMSDDEDDQFMDGFDPCVPVVRLYEEGTG